MVCLFMQKNVIIRCIQIYFLLHLQSIDKISRVVAFHGYWIPELLWSCLRTAKLVWFKHYTNIKWNETIEKFLNILNVSFFFIVLNFDVNV